MKRALIAQSVARQLFNLNVKSLRPDSDKIISVFFLSRLNSKIISIIALITRITTQNINLYTLKSILYQKSNIKRENFVKNHLSINKGIKVNFSDNAKSSYISHNTYLPTYLYPHKTFLNNIINSVQPLKIS